MVAISIVASPNRPPNLELMLALTGLLVSLWMNNLSNCQPVALVSSIGFLGWVVVALTVKTSDKKVEKGP